MKKQRFMNFILRVAPKSIQGTLMIAFTLVSVASMFFVSIMLYQNSEYNSRKLATESSQEMLSQATEEFESYLKSMRLLSDTMYYSVLKERDIAKENGEDSMSLLYASNKDNLVSVALFSKDGNLISASPSAVQKINSNVSKQGWFKAAMRQPENLHFSNPHVQRIFDDSSYRTRWVISLSRSVLLMENGVPKRGVLLVDMNYSTVDQIMTELNGRNTRQYVYLSDDRGNLIFHPEQMQISSGITGENSKYEAFLDDGIHKTTYNGEKRIVIVNTISYTGWKMISVIPTGSLNFNMDRNREFLAFIVLLTILMILILNQMVTIRVTKPLRTLADSIRDNGVIEALHGEAADVFATKVYIGGPKEVRYLGETVQELIEQISNLMQEIVIEQEEKRRSELDALQSQVNPHFLYNTLDSIVWMIEGRRNKDAIFMIKQLASLFRISLSKGQTIIKVRDEIQHAENYCNIQRIRFKDSFKIKFDISEEIQDCCTVKLIVQPIIENAINYGVKEMDEDGEIIVHGYKKDSDIYIDISDNGFGMTEDTLQNIFTETGHVHAKGSGVGLINVQSRISLMFGEDYGLIVKSEPDEGTVVTIHIPYTVYDECSRKKLEGGNSL